MCTALNLCTKDHYFGRNLDLDCSYGEQICVVPRHFALDFRDVTVNANHYAMIGMAIVISDFPMFYDATNEHGLSMAGLNFPQNAYYMPKQSDKDNISPYAFIPWVLCQCRTVQDARRLIERMNLVDIPFSDQVPLAPLHWIISDRDESIVVESMESGLHVYDNPVGILTNNPPFKYHLFHLNNYRTLRVDNGENHFSENLNLDTYCQGLGAIGLPGDVSSMSRFVRMAFNRAHSVCSEDEASSVSQFFHLLSSVEMVRGCCLTEGKVWDITVYSSCVNTDRGIYYYTTYDNHRIHCVDMHRTDLDSDTISVFALRKEQEIECQN